MNPYEQVQLLTLIERAARNAREHLALADMREGEARRPALQVAGGPPPPKPGELFQDAANRRAIAGSEVATIVGLASNFIAKPEAVVDEKVGGRLARLNGAAEA